MANVLVMTDTVACIPNDLARENNIEVVPAASISYDGQDYIEGVTLSASEAYEMIKKNPDHFMTAAITPGFLLDEYRRLSQDYQDILFITISSALSAVCQSARLAAESLSQESPRTTIRVMDSMNCAGAEGLVALAAARAAARGMDLEQIASFAEGVRHKTGGVLMLDTVKYTYRTGRMSKSEALEAAKLKIKPVNRMSNEGTIEFVDIVRKRSDGLNKLIELIGKDSETDALHFMVSHADAPDVARRFAEQLKQEFNCLSMIISDYSPVMGYSTGPGAIFAGFHPELDL